MVSASFAPLLAVVLTTLAGASAVTAANVGLVMAMALLAIHGWLAGRAAQLQGWKLLVATSIAAGLGLVMGTSSSGSSSTRRSSSSRCTLMASLYAARFTAPRSDRKQSCRRG